MSAKRRAPVPPEDVFEAMTRVKDESGLGSFKELVARCDRYSFITGDCDDSDDNLFPTNLLCCAAASKENMSIKLLEILLERNNNDVDCFGDTKMSCSDSYMLAPPIYWTIYCAFTSLNEQDKTEDEVVDLACKKLRLLFKHNVDLRCCEMYEGESVLHLLCNWARDYDDVSAKLMEMIFDQYKEDQINEILNKRNAKGLTPLSILMMRRSRGCSVTATLDLLLTQQGLDLERIANFSWTEDQYTYPLIYAALERDAETMQLLFDSGLDINPNVFDEHGRTPLRISAVRSAECVKELLAHPKTNRDLLIGDRTAQEWAQDSLKRGDLKTAILTAFGCKSEEEEEEDEEDEGEDEGEEEEEEDAPHFIDDVAAWELLSNNGNAVNPVSFAKLKSDLGLDDASDLSEITQGMFEQLRDELKPIKQSKLSKLFK